MLKISFSVNDVLKELKNIFSITSPNSEMIQYSHILIECTEDHVNFFASNLFLSLKIEIKKVINIISTGKCIVEAETFFNCINSLQDGVVTLELAENNFLSIKGNKYSAECPTVDLNGYSIMDFESSDDIQIKSKFFELINSKLSSLTSKKALTSPVRGILIEVNRKSKSIEAAATDSVALGCIHLPDESGVSLEKKIKAIVPIECIKTICSHNDKNDNLSISHNNERLIVKFKNYTYNCSTIVGEFPPVFDVCERNVKTLFSFVIKRNSLINAINRAKPFVDKNSTTQEISLEINENVLNISAVDVEKGSCQENIDISNNKAKSSITIKVDIQRFSELIKNIDTENIVFGFSSETKPVAILNENADYYESLIAPMN